MPNGNRQWDEQNKAHDVTLPLQPSSCCGAKPQPQCTSWFFNTSELQPNQPKRSPQTSLQPFPFCHFCINLPQRLLFLKATWNLLLLQDPAARLLTGTSWYTQATFTSSTALVTKCSWMQPPATGNRCSEPRQAQCSCCSFERQVAESAFPCQLPSPEIAQHSWSVHCSPAGSHSAINGVGRFVHP